MSSPLTLLGCVLGCVFPFRQHGRLVALDAVGRAVPHRRREVNERVMRCDG